MILVTGGAGFIGSNILATLEETGQGRLACCDRLGTGDKWKNIEKRDLAELLHPDELLDFLDLSGADLQAVAHMGAISATTETNADLIKRQNVDLTLELFDWCARAAIPFLYASSAATYGDGEAGFDDDPCQDAMARLRPMNAYGWSKHHADRRILRRVREGRPVPPQWVGLKFFNVYGPNEYHKGPQQSVVPQFHRQITECGSVRLFRSHKPGIEDGGQMRDFVDVHDCADLVAWLLRNPRVTGLFNVGSGQARSFLDLARAVFAAKGRDPRIEFIDTPKAIRDRYQYFTEARLERLREAGFERPATGLEAGVTRYVRDYLEAGDGYR